MIKETIGKATLYLGDSTELPAVEVHHTITDPPYEEREHATQGRLVDTARGRLAGLSFAAMDDETRQRISRIIAENTLGWALIFSSDLGAEAWRQAMPVDFYSTMLWIKPDGRHLFSGTGPGYGYEMLLSFRCRKTTPAWNGGTRFGIFTHNVRESNQDDFNIHQTIKPQGLMVELVTLFTNPGEIIFDPFMGSGSTGVAALSLDRHFIGVERDEASFAVACKRIEQAQQGLFNTQYVKTRRRETINLIDGNRPSIKVINKPVPRPAPPPEPERSGERLTYDEQHWRMAGAGAIALDVESFPNFFCVNVKHIKSGLRRSFELSERATFDPEELLAVLNQGVIISFNGNNYDLPMLALALKGFSAKTLFDAGFRIINDGLRPWQFERDYKVHLPRINHIDLMESNPSIRQGLKTLAGRLHVKQIVNLPFDPHTHLTKPQMSAVVDYCFHDLDALQALFYAMKEPIILREELRRRYKVDMRSKSDAQIGEAIIKTLAERLTGYAPVRPQSNGSKSFRYEPPSFIRFAGDTMKGTLETVRNTSLFLRNDSGRSYLDGLEKQTIKLGEATYTLRLGGLHSNEGSRALHSDNHHVLIDIDVASQYPNIILKLGMSPPAVAREFQPIYRNIVEERLAAKARGDRSTADGLKIAVNGVFGKMGSEYSFLFAPEMLAAVTLTGQLSLLMLIERLEAEFIPVMSGNTDGLIVLCPRRKLDMLNRLVAEWEEQTGFQAERTEYKAIYNRDVNTYIAVKSDGKVKRKGPVGNPWRDGDLRGQMMKNPQMTICSDAVVEYILNGTPFEQTIRASADPREFVTVTAVKTDGGASWRGQPLGEVVRYYWSTDGEPILRENGGKVSKTDGAKPLMELPGKLPADVDWQRYISETNRLAADLAVIGNGDLI